MKKDFEKIFTYIYENEVWGKGSGGGSMIENNREYIVILEYLMKDLNIKSVVDYGCGDWQFSKYINWGHINYIGIDCVKSLIDNNNKNFKKNNIDFIHLNSLEIPYSSDLLIVKDVFQHWEDESIVEFIDKNKFKFKYILITNTINGNWKHQTEHEVITRPINIEKYPLNTYNNIKKIFTLNKDGNDEKEVLLLTN